MAACALAAEAAGVESIWTTNHLAIPPDDAEGSGGRYMDTLATLAWLAGITTRVTLGFAVLILPYRAALATAKQIATIQELSGNRLVVGAGVGWMAAEFQALGVDRRARGRITDETLAFFNACFAGARGRGQRAEIPLQAAPALSHRSFPSRRAPSPPGPPGSASGRGAKSRGFGPGSRPFREAGPRGRGWRARRRCCPP